MMKKTIFPGKLKQIFMIHGDSPPPLRSAPGCYALLVGFLNYCNMKHFHWKKYWIILI